MRTKHNWRNGLGLSQIMATLLIVVPTLAFIVTFLLEYWALMQADYRLKLVANYTSDYLSSDGNLSARSDAIFDSSFINVASGLCPGGTSFTPKTYGDNMKDEISVTINYTYDGTYMKNKTISTTMQTYSLLKDQNITFSANCE